MQVHVYVMLYDLMNNKDAGKTKVSKLPAVETL
jgi:hypothetical protein